MAKNKTKLYVHKRKGKCGIKRWSDKELILPIEYDCITKFYDIFILVKDSKVGLSKTVINEDGLYSLDEVTPCKFNYIHYAGLNTFLLDDDKGTVYYNIEKDKLSDYYESVIAYDKDKFLQAQTKDKFYVINKLHY